MDRKDLAASSASARRHVDAAALALASVGVLLAVLAGGWFSWYPWSEGQLTIVGRSWENGPYDPACASCHRAYLFNWAFAATVLAPFVVGLAYLVVARRWVASSGDGPGARARGTAATLAGDLIGWVAGAAVFAVVGVAAAADSSNWNNFSSRYDFSDAGGAGDTSVFNWSWASAAAMLVVLAAAIAHGGTVVRRRPDARRAALWRVRTGLAVLMGLGGVAAAYASARSAGTFGTSLARRATGLVDVASGTNWLVFTPLAAGCVASATIRVVDLWTARTAGSPRTTARRLTAIGTAVGLAGVALATVLAFRFRLSAHRLFDWSGTASRRDRFNWTLFGLIAGPALVAAAAIALRGALTAAKERPPRAQAVLACLAVPVVGVLLAALLARHVGSDASRMSVLRGGDDGKPLFNRFVFFAACGPFVATAGAATAAALATRTRGDVAASPD